MKQHYTERDPRVRATAAIWGISIGMFGICIPLVAITNTGLLLPVLVLLGASVSTSAIWLATRPPQSENKQQLNQTVARLEERVRNLEAICSSADWNLQQPILLNKASEK